MKTSVLEYIQYFLYYNAEPVKLTPNASKSAKKCESFKIL